MTHGKKNTLIQNLQKLQQKKINRKEKENKKLSPQSQRSMSKCIT
jgi:hypothetical protein